MNFNKDNYLHMIQCLKEVVFDTTTQDKISKHEVSLQQDEVWDVLKKEWTTNRKKLIVVVTNQRDNINAYTFKIGGVALSDLKFQLSSSDWNTFQLHIRAVMNINYQQMKGPIGLRSEAAVPDLSSVLNSDALSDALKEIEKSGALNTIMQNANNIAQSLSNGENVDMGKLLQTFLNKSS